MEKIDKAANIVNTLAEFAKELVASIQKVANKLDDKKVQIEDKKEGS